MKYVTTHGYTFGLNVTDWQHSIDADAMEGLLEDIVMDLTTDQIEEIRNGYDDLECETARCLYNVDFIADQICDAYNVITADFLGEITEGHVAEIYYVGVEK
jgi:hypothetical protein